jgi:hypothetical protein
MKQLHKDAVVLHPLPRVDEVRATQGFLPHYIQFGTKVWAAEVEEEEGCYMGRTSDYVATKPWMYGKEDPCAGPGWRERTARKGENPTPQASAEGTV